MATQEEQSGIELEAARQLARKFDADRAVAQTDFRLLLTKKTQAGKVLQNLNRLDRQDVTLTLSEAVSLDARTDALVIIERARAFVSTGAPELAEELLAKMSASRRFDYAFNYNAGRVMGEARLFPQALAYYEAAFDVKPTAQAAERVFRMHLALEQYPQAAVAIGRLIRSGSHRAELTGDINFVLTKIAPGDLDPELAFALASLPEKNDSRISKTLLQHLIASDLLDSVRNAIEPNLADISGWSEETLVRLVAYLQRRDQIDLLLRIYEQSATMPDVLREAVAAAFSNTTQEQINMLSIPNIAGFSEGASAKLYRETVEKFLQTGDAEAALAMLRVLPGTIAGNQAQAFFAREKAKLSRLVAYVHDAIGIQGDVRQALVEFIAFWCRAKYAPFFADESAAELMAAISNAVRMDKAPTESKAAHLREDYFGFNLERRFIKLSALTNDFGLCNAALAYFAFVSGQRPLVEAPVGRDLAERLGRETLSLDEGKPLDRLTSFFLMQDRPGFALEESSAYDAFCWWYATALMGPKNIPPGAQQPDVIAHLNEAPQKPNAGVPATRFLNELWSHSDEYRKAYDPGLVIDRVLLILEAMQSMLWKHSQYLPLFMPFLARESLFADVLTAISAKPNLIEAVRGDRVQPVLVTHDAPQDILLIGHTSKDSGLGRNFGMLKNGLAAAGALVTGVDFDAHPSTANDQIVRWRENCRSRPMAVFAVNANDMPDFFLKDSRGILLDTYNCGFFLWEVSTIPDVQKLALNLVDEIWAPTKYVADIYAPFKPAYTIGKGLFEDDAMFQLRERPSKPNSPFTFVTVFDFDSSIERKNPLAVVLAFQDAFGIDEDVRLIVKTSNVNPQHWSNVWKQWEHMLGASAGDKRVEIVNQRFTGEQMTALVRDADCIVSLHRSEGFGYLISDAMAFGTPVIATDYSGNVDFANGETAYPVSYSLIPIPDGAARWHCEGAVWADADVANAARQMRAVFDNHGEALAKAGRARDALKSRYSVNVFAETLKKRIASIRQS
ncbi:MAG: glycosyltransferase [Rhizomicrobium sp.]